jgi:hypothetical protein
MILLSVTNQKTVVWKLMTVAPAANSVQQLPMAAKPFAA